MAWLCTDKDGMECIFEDKPHRFRNFVWAKSDNDTTWCPLPCGSIKKLIGYELTWENEPVELKDE